MTHYGIGLAPSPLDVAWGWRDAYPYPTRPRRMLGQWEMIGSVAAASGASYGTMLWGESEVSEFFSTVYGQVLTTALNMVGMIWGIPLGSIVQGLAEMFGGIFGGGMSHEEREALEMQRTAGQVRIAAGQIQRELTLTALYNRLVFWDTTYVGGSCGGSASGQCIAFQVRPLLYAPPDVQPVTKGGLGVSVPGGTPTYMNAPGYMGLPRGTDLRVLAVDAWPWVRAGYTGRPSHWYPTTTETGFFRALISDPVRRFRVGVQAGVAQSMLAPLNKQLADVIRGAVAKIIQRDYGQAIVQAIALAESTVSGTIPTPQQVAAAMARPGGVPIPVTQLMQQGMVQAGIRPGTVPTTQQIAIAMAPAAAASPGTGSSWLPMAAVAAGLYFATQGGG